MKGQKGYLQVPCAAHSGFSLKAAWHKVARWYQLSHERALLASLNDDALKDLGLSRADVEHETHQHFWHDPLAKCR